MTKISAPRAPRSTKKIAVAPVDALVLNHTESIEVIDAGDAALSALIASLDMPEPDEVIEAVSDIADDTAAEVIEAAPDTTVDTAMLDAAVNGAEAIDVMVAAATPDDIDGSAVPTGDASDVVTEPPVAAKTPKAPKVPKEKKVAVPRKHYSGDSAKTDRLHDKLGAGLVDYSVLTLADAGVTDAELGAVMEGTMIVIRSLNKKAQTWAVKFIEFMAGKKAALSEVTSIILKTLERDGFLTTGNEGNMLKALIARPYSPGAARAMGGNNMAMLVALKVIQADGKGRFIANPDSLLAMKINSMIFADGAAASEEDEELTADDTPVEAVSADAPDAVEGLGDEEIEGLDETVAA